LNKVPEKETIVQVGMSTTPWRKIFSNTAIVALVGSFLYYGTTFVWDASQRNSSIDSEISSNKMDEDNQIASLKMEEDTTSAEEQQLAKNQDGIQVSLIQIQTTLATLAQEMADDRAERGHGSP
jgi:hypothetical protein